MKIHFDEKILQIPEDFIQKNKSILEFLHDKESIKLHDNYIEFNNLTGIFVVEVDPRNCTISLVKKLKFLYKEVKKVSREWVEYYNKERLHQALDCRTPDEIYYGKEVLIMNNKIVVQN